MARILVADDERDIHELIRRYAERDGYEVMTVTTGLEAVQLCRENDFDIIIMDVMMPEMDGFKASKEIKKIKDIPILMLSARGEEYDKLFGFEVGADDYVVKSFSPKELMARVEVIVSRHGKQSPRTDRRGFGRIEIDLPGRGVYIDGAEIELTAKEFDVLLYLAEHSGMALPETTF